MLKEILVSFFLLSMFPQSTDRCMGAGREREEKYFKDRDLGSYFSKTSSWASIITNVITLMASSLLSEYVILPTNSICTRPANTNHTN